MIKDLFPYRQRPRKYHRSNMGGVRHYVVALRLRLGLSLMLVLGRYYVTILRRRPQIKMTQSETQIC